MHVHKRGVHAFWKAIAFCKVNVPCELQYQPQERMSSQEPGVESGTTSQELGVDFESGTRLARVRNSWPTSRELNMQLASGTEALSLQLGARVENWS